MSESPLEDEVDRGVFDEDLPALNTEPDNDPDDAAPYLGDLGHQDPEGTETPEQNKHEE